MKDKYKHKLVSGPVVCFRLEGYVDKIKKVVYLFGDIHEDIEYQSQCPSWKSDDFIRYFTKTMSKTNKKKQYDLLFESTTTRNYDNFTRNINNKDIYITELEKYFKNTINIVNNNGKNKNIGSKDEPNLRIHNINIRNDIYIQIGDYQTQLYKLFKIIYESNNLYDNDIDTIKNISEKYINLLQYILACIANNKSTLNNEYISEDEIKKIKKYAYKINHNYTHKEIYNILIKKSDIYKRIFDFQDEIEKILLNLCEDSTIFFEHLSNNNGILHKINKHFSGYYVSFFTKVEKLFNLFKNASLFSDTSIQIGVYLMDLYTLKRLLDKDYIENAIIYSGNMHNFNYLYTLVKNFNFNITHTTTKLSAKEIENLIFTNNLGEDLYVKIMPYKLLQCIDMSDFPDNFE
jgi:hypothetical protein